MALRNWKKTDSKKIFILSEGAKKYSVIAWKSKKLNKYEINPAISMVKNIVNGYNVQFFGISKNRIVSFKTKKQALAYAKAYMRKH